MKKLLLIGVASLLSGCFDGGSNPAGKDSADNGSSPKLVFTSSAAQVEQGDSVQLDWQGEDVENCQAEGAWSGAKAVMGTETVSLSILGHQTFSLSCEAIQSSEIITRNTTVEVVTVASGDDPKSGLDGDDADALYEHFNQYAQ